MEKRILAALLAIAMLGLSLTGCYKTVRVDQTSGDDTADSLSSKIITVSDDSSLEDEIESLGDEYDGTSQDDEYDQGHAGETTSQKQQTSKPTTTSTGGTSSNASQQPDPSEPAGSSGPSKNTYGEFDKYYEYGAEHIERAAKDYWKNGYMVEVIGSGNRSTLWPYTIYVEAVGERLDADPNNQAVRNEYIKCLNTFEIYRHRRTDGYLAYSSATNGSRGTGDRYYDDNAWVCIEFIHAYQRGFGKEWLEKAEGVAAFCYSGWDTGNALGIPGGIFWMEGRKNEKNTCINAPMAYAYAMLYEETKKSDYLSKAEQIYDWTKKYMMNPPVEGQQDRDDYLYYDRVEYNSKGEIVWDRTPRGYNVGNMIAAGAKLYKINGDKQYLTDARLSAAAAYNRFGREIVRNGSPCYAFTTSDAAMDTWFNSNLLKGYLELYKVDKTPTNRKYVEGFRMALAHACMMAQDERGYVAHNWKAMKEDTNADLRGVGGTGRVLFMLAKWIKGYYDK